MSNASRRWHFRPAKKTARPANGKSRIKIRQKFVIYHNDEKHASRAAFQDNNSRTITMQGYWMPLDLVDLIIMRISSSPAMTHVPLPPQTRAWSVMLTAIHNTTLGFVDITFNHVPSILKRTTTSTSTYFCCSALRYKLNYYKLLPKPRSVIDLWTIYYKQLNENYTLKLSAWACQSQSQTCTMCRARLDRTHIDRQIKLITVCKAMFKFEESVTDFWIEQWQISQSFSHWSSLSNETDYFSVWKVIFHHLENYWLLGQLLFLTVNRFHFLRVYADNYQKTIVKLDFRSPEIETWR